MERTGTFLVNHGDVPQAFGYRIDPRRHDRDLRRCRPQSKRHHVELAEIATKARPGLLILYHRANPGGVGRPNPEQVLLEEIRQLYGGKVVIGHDLDVF